MKISLCHFWDVNETSKAISCKVLKHRERDRDRRNATKIIFETFISDEGPTLETLDFTIRIDSTPTFLYFDLYLNTAYAAHYI